MGTVHRGISFLSLTRVGGAGGIRRRLRTRPPVARRDARACGIANDAGPGRSPGLQADAIASSAPPSRAVGAVASGSDLGLPTVAGAAPEWEFLQEIRTGVPFHPASAYTPAGAPVAARSVRIPRPGATWMGFQSRSVDV